MGLKFVIVGGSFASLAAHKLAHQVLKESGAEITVVSSSDQFWFNLSAPRVLVQPHLLSATVFNLRDAIEAKGGKFVHSTCEHADLTTQMLQLGNGEQIKYDHAVFATGARAHDAFKINKTAETSMIAVNRLSERIASSQDIVLAGGGPTGVELAAEVKYAYPDKKVRLYTGSEYPLPNLTPAQGAQAMEKLEGLGVEVVNGVKVETQTDPNAGVLALDDGSTIDTELYIPAVGVTPNTEYLRKDYLDSKGFIKTDENLRIIGASNAYAFGDCTAIGAKTFVDIMMNQNSTLKASLKHDILGVGKLSPYCPSAHPTMLVPISKQGGIGVFKGWQTPEFFVRKAKGDNYMIPMAASFTK